MPGNNSGNLVFLLFVWCVKVHTKKESKIDGPGKYKIEIKFESRQQTEKKHRKTFENTNDGRGGHQAGINQNDNL